MNFSFSTRAGFTIVELIIVVVVIAILAAVAVVGYNGVTSSGRDKALISDIDKVEAELTRYVSRNNGTYSTALEWDSSTGSNPNIAFSPSSGNVVVVKVVGEGFCIKAYNPKTANNTLANAKKSDACNLLWKTINVGGSPCAVATDNKVYCWGANSAGQVGNGTTVNAPLPTAVSTTGVLAGKAIRSIAVGTAHACAVDTDGLAYCWGSNTFGQLGDGTFTSSSSPVAVVANGALAGLKIQSINSSAHHTCVVASDGNAYCWGRNADGGNLGDGTSTNRSSPVAVTRTGVLSGKSIQSLSAGNTHTCAIASDANAYCWGNDTWGVLGDGTPASGLNPVAVTSTGVLAGKTLRGVSSGQTHACVLSDDGAVYCWGSNSYGQLGTGATSSLSNVPVEYVISGILSGKKVKSLGTNQGIDTTCLIASDDLSYCLGRNTWGQSGNGTTTSSLVPLQTTISGVLVGKTLDQLTMGSTTTCSVGQDKNAYCWGYRGEGQTGNGISGGNAASPVKVTAPTV